MLVASPLLVAGAFSLLVAQEKKSTSRDQAAKATDAQKSGSKAEDQAANKGTIQGKVDSPWVKRRPAVVYLRDVPGKFSPPKENPVMDQRGLRFIPHVLPVLVGSTVDFPNHDKVRHNVLSPSYSAQQFNLGMYPAGQSKQVTCKRVGVVPVLCNVHTEMSAFILVLPNPYFAVTDKQGNFTIKDIPAGTYTLTFWHEKLRSTARKVPVKAGNTIRETFRELKKGHYNVNLTGIK